MGNRVSQSQFPLPRLTWPCSRKYWLRSLTTVARLKCRHLINKWYSASAVRESFFSLKYYSTFPSLHTYKAMPRCKIAVHFTYRKYCFLICVHYIYNKLFLGGGWYSGCCGQWPFSTVPVQTKQHGKSLEAILVPQNFLNSNSMVTLARADMI